MEELQTLILHDWTHQSYFSLHIKYQSYSCPRLIAESRRRASRYAEHSDVANVTSAGYNGINAIVTASILLNVHTIQSNKLHMMLNPLIIYICTVNILYADANAMLFRSAIPFTVWRAPCCSEFNTFDVKLSVIMVCLPAMFELSEADKTSENSLCHW